LDLLEVDFEVVLVDLEVVALLELEDLLELVVLVLVVFALVLPEVFAKLSLNDSGAKNKAATNRKTIKKRRRNM
jgi:hypothetical protein